MTARPDLAALARELRECAASWEPGARLLGNVEARGIVAVCNAVLIEPPAEADTLCPTYAACPALAECEAERDALRALLAAKPSNERWQELLATERAMFAAAPLFEACHLNGLTRRQAHAAMRAWALSEAGQRWKKEQGK